MTKKLTLRGRGPEEANRPEWHDVFILQNAIKAIVKNKTMRRVIMWLDLSASIRQAIAREGSDFEQRLPDLEISLTNKTAKVLWRELDKLRPEVLGWDGRKKETVMPDLGLLFEMMQDWADQLGQVLVVDD